MSLIRVKNFTDGIVTITNLGSLRGKQESTFDIDPSTIPEDTMRDLGRLSERGLIEYEMLDDPTVPADLRARYGGSSSEDINLEDVGIESADTKGDGTSLQTTTDGGFAPPQMTTAQRTAITLLNQADQNLAMIVFDTDLGNLQLYTPGPNTWAELGAQGPAGPPGADGADGADGAAGPLIVWQGDWNVATPYVVNEAVARLGSSYLAVQANTGVDPDLDGGANWTLIASIGDTGAQGIQGDPGPQGDPGADGADGAAGPLVTWQGAWDVGTAYVVNDAVSRLGSSYLAIQATTGVDPDGDGEVNWAIIAEVGAAGPLGPGGGDILSPAGTATVRNVPVFTDVNGTQTDFTGVRIAADGEIEFRNGPTGDIMLLLTGSNPVFPATYVPGRMYMPPTADPTITFPGLVIGLPLANAGNESSVGIELIGDENSVVADPDYRKHLGWFMQEYYGPNTGLDADASALIHHVRLLGTLSGGALPVPDDVICSVIQAAAWTSGGVPRRLGRWEWRTDGANQGGRLILYMNDPTDTADDLIRNLEFRNGEMFPTVDQSFTIGRVTNRIDTLYIRRLVFADATEQTTAGGGGAPGPGTLTVTNINFGNVENGQTDDQTVTLSAAGGDVEVTGVVYGGADAARFTTVGTPFPLTITSGGSELVTIRYTPGEVAAHTATAIFSGDQTNGDQVSSLQGVGTAPGVTTATLTPNPLDLGNVVQGENNTGQMTIDVAGGDVTINSVTRTAGSTNFTVVSTVPATPALVADGGSMIVNLRYDAPTPAVGGESATITVDDTADVGDASSTVQAVSVQTQLTVAPDPIAFPDTNTGSTNDVTVTLTAVNGDVEVTAVGLSGVDAAQFSFVGGAPATPFTVQPGIPVQFDIRFSPAAAQAYVAQLDISSDAQDSGTEAVAITGTGTTPLAFDPLTDLTDPRFLVYGDRDVTETAGDVSAWGNQVAGGSAYPDAANATALEQPSIASTGPSSRQVVVFDASGATGQRLQIFAGDPLGDWPNDNDYIMYGVLRCDGERATGGASTGPGDAGIVCSTGNNGVGPWFNDGSANAGGGSGTLAVEHWHQPPAPESATVSRPANGTWFSWCVTYIQSTGTLTIYIDGVQVDSQVGVDPYDVLEFQLGCYIWTNNDLNFYGAIDVFGVCLDANIANVGDLNTWLNAVRDGAAHP